MQGVQNFKNDKHIKVHCPNGFANQLRLLLAGAFLSRNKYIESYTQEWVLNNHNNVDFLDYFKPLDGVQFTQVDKQRAINSTTFQMMIKTYTKNTVAPIEALQEIKNQLQPKETIKKHLDYFLKDKSLDNYVGVHVRRTCKLSFLNLEESKYRTVVKLASNEEVYQKIKNYKNIFLATDNQETQNWFKDKLKDNILIYSTILSGQEVSELPYTRNAVVRHTLPLHTVMDFLILLQTGIFLGTDESSFSSLIKNIRNNFEDFLFYGKV